MTTISFNPKLISELREICSFPVELDGKRYVSKKSSSFIQLILSLMAEHPEIPRRGKFFVYLNQKEIYDLYKRVDIIQFYHIYSENYITALGNLGWDIVSIYSDKDFIFVFHENGALNVWKKFDETLIGSYFFAPGIKKVVYNEAHTYCLLTGEFDGIIIVELTPFLYVKFAADWKFFYAAFSNRDRSIIAIENCSNIVRIFNIRTGLLLATHETIPGIDFGISTNFHSSVFVVFGKFYFRVVNFHGFIQYETRSETTIKDVHILGNNLYISREDRNYSINLKTKFTLFESRGSELTVKVGERLVFYRGDTISFDDENYKVEKEVVSIFSGKDEFFSLHVGGSVMRWRF